MVFAKQLLVKLLLFKAPVIMHWEIEMEEELVRSNGLCKGTIKLTIEVLAFDLFTMANSPFKLS